MNIPVREHPWGMLKLPLEIQWAISPLHYNLRHCLLGLALLKSAGTAQAMVEQSFPLSTGQHSDPGNANSL